MKTKNIKSLSFLLVVVLGLSFGLTSCNKDLPYPEPITYPVATTTIGKYIATDTNFKLFRLALVRTNLLSLLSDSNKVLSVFAPSNAAFRAFGFDSLQIVTANAATATSLGSIINYSIIPGLIVNSDQIPTTFPNVQLPTNIALGVLPGTTVPFPLTAFLSRRGTDFWFNNAPGVPTMVKFVNGTLNVVSKVTPPQVTSTGIISVASIISGDPNLSLYKALIDRGDSGQLPENKFDSIMKNPGANITSFAPNNAAVRVLLLQSGFPAGLTDAQYAGAIGASFPVASARGLVAYSLLAAQNSVGSYVPHRVFSVNFTSTPTFYKTLVNSSVAAHPGVNVTSFFTGLVVDSMKVVGVGAGSQVATAKPPSNFDRQAANGVVHVIDQILRPQ